MDCKTSNCKKCGMAIPEAYLNNSGICAGCNVCEAKEDARQKAEFIKVRGANKQPKKGASKKRKSKNKAQRKARKS